MMMAGHNFEDEEEEQVNLHSTTRRLLSGVICAGLLVATMGAATYAQTPVAGSPVSGEAATAEPGQDVKMM
jgi:hypothetical protein